MVGCKLQELEVPFGIAFLQFRQTLYNRPVSGSHQHVWELLTKLPKGVNSNAPLVNLGRHYVIYGRLRLVARIRHNVFQDAMKEKPMFMLKKAVRSSNSMCKMCGSVTHYVMGICHAENSIKDPLKV